MWKTSSVAVTLDLFCCSANIRVTREYGTPRTKFMLFSTGTCCEDCLASSSNTRYETAEQPGTCNGWRSVGAH